MTDFHPGERKLKHTVYGPYLDGRRYRKLTDEQFLEILNSDEKTSVLAFNYGVNHSTIWAIRNGKIKRKGLGK